VIFNESSVEKTLNAAFPSLFGLFTQLNFSPVAYV